jgi:hypothetical protein
MLKTVMFGLLAFIFGAISSAHCPVVGHLFGAHARPACVSGAACPCQCGCSQGRACGCGKACVCPCGCHETRVCPCKQQSSVSFEGEYVVLRKPGSSKSIAVTAGDGYSGIWMGDEKTGHAIHLFDAHGQFGVGLFKDYRKDRACAVAISADANGDGYLQLMKGGEPYIFSAEALAGLGCCRK